MTENLIPLAELVAEGFAENIAALANRLDGSVFLDDIGRRCTTRDIARGMFVERAAEQEALQRQREEMAAQPNLSRRRVRALQARQAALRQEGLIAADTPASIVLAAGDRNSNLERAGRMRDELISAGNRGDFGVMHIFKQKRL